METEILIGNCLEKLKELSDGSVQCCVTSPPYWGLRNYQMSEQLGLEETPEEYVENMVQVFREVKRVLRDDGTLWLNLGDSYAMNSIRGGTKKFSGNVGSHSHYEQSIKKGKRRIPDGLKRKDLVGIPWRVAFALQADGWYLRQDIIWHKPNPMPESVTDRCTKAHEYIFLLSKNKKYYYDHEAIKEKSFGKWNSSKGFNKSGQSARNIENRIGNREDKEQSKRNKRSVWTVTTKPFKGAHFATFPPDLIEPCILAGTSDKGCCADCGTPYKRIIEKDRVATRTGEDTKTEGLPDSVIGNRDPLRHVTSTQTVGWEKNCNCTTTEIDPCVVLDPFAGSGTTLAVALKRGRQGVGIELNPDYAKLAEKRIEQNGSLFTMQVE